MFILRKKKGEKILINDNIKIVAVASSDNYMWIGIEAPEEFKIKRTNKENKNANSI